MIVGVPKEIKTREYRVGMTPAGVKSLTSRGHKVLIEKSAGEGSGISDAEYVAQGGVIVATAADAWGAEMVVKVKEPLPAEYGFFRRNLVLYTYLHLAAELELTKKLAESGVTGVAYETIELADGSLPLLRPMSEVAGRMAVQVGATPSTFRGRDASAAARAAEAIGARAPRSCASVDPDRTKRRAAASTIAKRNRRELRPQWRR